MKIEINQKVWITILKTTREDILLNKPKVWRCDKVTDSGFSLRNKGNDIIPVLFRWESRPCIFESDHNDFTFKIDFENPKPSFNPIFLIPVAVIAFVVFAVLKFIKVI